MANSNCIANKHRRNGLIDLSQRHTLPKKTKEPRARRDRKPRSYYCNSTALAKLYPRPPISAIAWFTTLVGADKMGQARWF